MNGKRLCIAALTIIAFLVIGQGVAYWANPYSHDADASMDGDTMNYSVSSNSSKEYSVIAFTDLFERADHLHIYYDEGYANPSLSHSAQAKSIDQYESELKKRNFGYSEVNASGLKEMMEAGTGTGKAILMTSGAFPNTVYEGSADDIVLQWLRSGGTVYWVGDHIGKYSSSGGEVNELNGTDTLFFGISNAVNGSGGKIASIPSADRELGETLSMTGNSTANGLASGMADTVYPGFETDGFSSIALTKVNGGTGMVAVFGGNLGDARISVVQAVASGISYMSDDSSYQCLDGRVRGNVTGSAEVTGATAAYIYIGKYNTVFGKAFRF